MSLRPQQTIDYAATSPVKWIDPNALKPNPVNAELYEVRDDEEQTNFENSILKNGV